jgi:hypothetical protein
MRMAYSPALDPPHPEEGANAPVSKDGAAMVRDAALREAPHHEADLA